MVRHSGPSNDLAQRVRTLPEAQKRGRWASTKTMNRYERHGRMGQDWARLTCDQRRLLTLWDAHLEDIFHGRGHPCH
eukprot:2154451-Lingulodinium_polyedra.AAC.1